MTAYRHRIAESQDPPIHYESFRFDGIRFWRCTFPPGAWQTYTYARGTLYSAAPTCHINVSGVMGEATGLWPDQGPGWMSREEGFVIPAGTFTRIAKTHCVRWCCTGVSDADHSDFVSTHRLAPGDAITLRRGDNLLIADGELEHEGRRFRSTQRVKASSGDVALLAAVDTLVFRWSTHDVEAIYGEAKQ